MQNSKALIALVIPHMLTLAQLVKNYLPFLKVKECYHRIFKRLHSRRIYKNLFYYYPPIYA
jgi:hypothetical protein